MYNATKFVWILWVDSSDCQEAAPFQFRSRQFFKEMRSKTSPGVLKLFLFTCEKRMKQAPCRALFFGVVFLVGFLLLGERGDTTVPKQIIG